jgi:hypothetical protein
MRSLILVTAIAICSVFSQIPTNGLVAYYPFNGNANDESGNGNHGTVNGALLTTGRFGNANSAYSFDGVDDNITVPNNNEFDIQLGNGTISAWVNMRGQGEFRYNTLVSKGNTVDNFEYILFAGDEYSRDGRAAFSFYDGTNNPSAVSTTILAYNEWYHVAGVYNGNDVFIYINGTLEGTDARGAYNASPSSDPLVIGEWARVNRSYNGIIDDLAVYNRALSGNEIMEIYQADNWTLSFPPIIIPVRSPTYNRRPMFSWHLIDEAVSYRIQASMDNSFSSYLFNVSQSDTFYIHSEELPFGIIYWRVENEFSNLFSETGTVIIKDSAQQGGIIYVTEEYSTLQAAIDAASDGDTILCSSIPDGETIIISNKDIHIKGYTNDGSKVISNTEIKIDNSLCTIENIEINARNGADGGESYEFPPLLLCDPISEGGAGGNAIEINASKVILINVELNGGNGGTGGICRTCMDYECVDGGIPVDVRSGGKGGDGIFSEESEVTLINVLLNGGVKGASIYPPSPPDGLSGRFLNYSKVDTLNLKFESIFVDETSSIGIASSIEKCINRIKKWTNDLRVINKNGRLHFKLNINTDEFQEIFIYDVSGNLLSNFPITRSQEIIWPRYKKLCRNIIIGFKNGNQKYYKLFKLNK